MGVMYGVLVYLFSILVCGCLWVGTICLLLVLLLDVGLFDALFGVAGCGIMIPLCL